MDRARVRQTPRLRPPAWVRARGRGKVGVRARVRATATCATGTLAAVRPARQRAKKMPRRPVW